MQGASILVASKVYENDIGRGASSLSAGTSNSKGFTDCLRKQSQLINSGTDEAATNTDTTESRPAKLDRSALLRVPLAKNSRASKNTANDAAGCETVVADADKTGTPLVTDCSAVQAQPQTKADTGATAEPAVVEQQAIEAVAVNLTATGSALPLEVVQSPGSPNVQLAMEKDTAESSTETADMVITVANSNATPELQPREGITQDNLIQVTKEPVLVADSSEKPEAEAPQPEGNQINSSPESTELSCQNNSIPVSSGKTVPPAQAEVATVELKSPDSPPPAAIAKAQPSPENVPVMDGPTQTTVTEAGTEVPNQTAPKLEAEQVLPQLEAEKESVRLEGEKSSPQLEPEKGSSQLEAEKDPTRLEVDSVPPQLATDPAPLQPLADRPELSLVSNQMGTVALQPVADQTISTEAPEAALGSAMPLEDIVAAVATPAPKPAQAAKDEAKENRSEVKSDVAGAKNVLEVVKAMAGKLEEPESNPSVQADKKENPGSGELKKLMEFESNRLQAAPLKDTSSGTGNSSPADKQAMVTVTLLPQTPAISDVSPTQVTKLSEQVPVDVKSLIDQVVQKAELTVKANSSEMKIQLEPEFLGKLTIKIAVEDGLLTARFTTENHQVKHLLESNLSTLRQSLEAQGIKVEKTEVNVQLDSGGTFGGYQEGRQEMWQRPETPNYPKNSYNNEGYEMIGGEDQIDPVFSQNEYYGIHSDGSMNFVI